MTKRQLRHSCDRRRRIYIWSA